VWGFASLFFTCAECECVIALICAVHVNAQARKIKSGIYIKFWVSKIEIFAAVI
jgi:hypothetical protein